jgi:hypothetical protein
MSSKIPFNKPFVVGKELYYVAQAVTFGNLGGDGRFTQLCRQLLKERFGYVRRTHRQPYVGYAPIMIAILTLGAWS